MKQSNKNEEAIKAVRELQAEAKRNGTYKMTLEEINAEINAARRERRKKESSKS